MKIFYRYISWVIIGMSFGILAQTAHAGAWNLPAGEGQIISTFDYSKAKSAFTDIEVDNNSLSFVKTEGRVFYEHGLTQKLNFVGNGAYQTLQISDGQSQTNFSDFADIELGLRYEVDRKEHSVISLQGSYIIGGGPPSSILDFNGPDDSIELRGLWGRSQAFKNSAVFFEAQGALRSKSFSNIDEWHTDFTLGYKRNDKYLLLGQLFHARRKSIEQDGFAVPTQQRVKLKLSAVYEYKKNRHVQIGYEQTIAGRNIVRERGLSVGTWLKY